MPTRRKNSRFKKKSHDHTLRSANRHLYNNNKWKKYSKSRRLKNRRCKGECGLLYADIASLVTDHIIPHNQGGSFWDKLNHQTMCIPCHNSKSAREKSGIVIPFKYNSNNEKIPA